MYDDQRKNDTVTDVILYKFLSNAGFEVAKTEFEPWPSSNRKYITDGQDQGLSLAEYLGVPLLKSSADPDMQKIISVLFQSDPENNPSYSGYYRDVLETDIRALKDILGESFHEDIDKKYLARLVALTKPLYVHDAQVRKGGDRLAKINPDFGSSHATLGTPIYKGRRQKSFTNNFKSLDPMVLEWFFEGMYRSLAQIKNISPEHVNELIQKHNNIGLNQDATNDVINHVKDGISFVTDSMRKDTANLNKLVIGK